MLPMCTTSSSFPTPSHLVDRATVALRACGVGPGSLGQGAHARSSITGTPLLPYAPVEDVSPAVAVAERAFTQWRTTPAPARGAVVKRFGALLEEHLDHLAELITLEIGKLPVEARGEIHELVEMCELAVGLSRQLGGRTIPSGRPGFRLVETYHPLGPIAVITPFSFPAAVWGWTAPVALVAGNPLLWKPSEHAPLTALACAALLRQAALEHGAPAELCQVLLGGAETGRRLAAADGVPLVAVSGATETGRDVAGRVAARLGRYSLHLSGNNASIITPTADLESAVSGVRIAATAATGQRCTSMRRLIVHRSRLDDVTAALRRTYAELVVGNPLDGATTVGPLLHRGSYDAMTTALDEALAQGGTVLAGGLRRHAEAAPDAYYVDPAVVLMPEQSAVVHRETLAPVLYLIPYDSLDEAIGLNNAVPQGFTSSIYTRDQSETQRFLSTEGSDTGIVNVNLHTSGAEVSVAFGGDKATGGGRQCGSDTWQTYMRRATSAIS